MNGTDFDIDMPAVVVILSVIAAGGVQLLLCRKSKRVFLRLLPVAVFALCTAVFGVLSAVINGWDGLGYLFFALLSFVLTIVCGIVWAVWAAVNKSKHRSIK